MFEPVYRSWTRKADLHIMLADVLERGNMIDPDQPPFADDRHAVAGMLDLRQSGRGTEEGLAISTHLGHHFVEFLLIERVQSAGRCVQYAQAWLVPEGPAYPQFL